MTMTLHRNVDPDSNCGGQVATAHDLFHKDYWCVYCGAKFDVPNDVTFHKQQIFGSYNPAICAHLDGGDGTGLSCLFWLGDGMSVMFGTCMNLPHPNITEVTNPERFGDVSSENTFRNFVTAFVNADA